MWKMTYYFEIEITREYGGSIHIFSNQSHNTFDTLWRDLLEIMFHPDHDVYNRCKPDDHVKIGRSNCNFIILNRDLSFGEITETYERRRLLQRRLGFGLREAFRLTHTKFRYLRRWRPNFQFNVVVRQRNLIFDLNFRRINNTDNVDFNLRYNNERTS
jgi:hypothetical protein